jgi:predicted ester cyclase
MSAPDAAGGGTPGADASPAQEDTPGVSGSPAAGGSSDAGATPEAVARAYFDAVARQDLDAMCAPWAPNAADVIHGVVEMEAPQGIREWFGALFAAFPDFRFEVLDVMAGEEMVAVHWRARGTFDGRGSFEGLRPNGARVALQGCDVLTIRAGMIQRNDAYMNGAEMARQLGALPPAGSAPERAMTGLLNAKTALQSRLHRRRSH